MTDTPDESSFTQGSAQAAPGAVLPVDIVKRTMLRAVSAPTLMAWILSSCIAALIGPFGTYEQFSYFETIYIWLLLNGTATIVIYACYALVGVVFGETQSRVFDVAFLLVGAWACTTTLDGLLMHWLQAAPEQRPSYAQLFVFVAVIMITIQVVRETLPALMSQDQDSVSDTSRLRSASDDLALYASSQVVANPSAKTRLFERLGMSDNEAITRVAAQGHYVEITTSEDLYRLRLRFSDTLRELEGLEGVTTHRSHWVALDAIAGCNFDAEKPYLRTKSGDTIPISKTYRSDVEKCALRLQGAGDLNGPL